MPVPQTKITIASALLGGRANRLTPVASGDFDTALTGNPVPAWISSIGDLDGDGVADIVVGAASDDDKAIDAGRIFVHRGQSTGGDQTQLTASPDDITIDGVSADDLAGFSVGAIGDLDGDGRAEILVGAPGMDVDSLADAGTAFVLWGPTAGGSVDLGDPAGESNSGKGFAILGAHAGDRAGSVVLALDDVTGDGRQEILVGAPGLSVGGGDAEGGVYVVFGKKSGATVNLSAVDTGTGGYRIVGEDGGDAVGAVIGTVADMNGDGRAEILIGAPDKSLGGGGSEGMAYVVFGKTGGAQVELADVAAGTGGFRIVGQTDDDAGAALAGLGDVNGDGLGDFILGAPRSNSAYVVFGKADGVEVNLADVASGLGGFRILGEGVQDLDALALAGGADFNRDGINDIVIGAPNNEEGGADAGAVYVVWGGGSVTVDLAQVALGVGGAKIVGAAGSLLGGTVAIAPDMDGDGTADLLIGAAGGGGAVYTVFTPTEWQPDFTVYGTDGDDQIGPGYGTALHAVGDDADVIEARDGNDSVDAAGGNDAIDAGAGDDTIDGGAGNDTLDGGTGGDHMAGGDGNDRFLVDDALDTVTEGDGPDSGVDTVVSDVDFVLPAHVEILQLGGAAHVGTGNAGANTIIGTAGDDQLDGAGGADLLAGGAGDDTYWVDDAGDQIEEGAGGGQDVVVASVDHVLDAQVEVLQVVGEGVQGTGNDGDNLLLGSAGHQILVGGLGHDTLDGGTGGDRMEGGGGNDTYYVDDLADLVIEAADGGIDTVVTAFTGTIAENIENIRLTGTAHAVTGNTGNNTLSGNDGNDSLDGGAGDDLLLGGAGDDELRAHAGRDVLAGGSGDDVYVVRGATSVHIEDFLGHDRLDASEAEGDTYIDLSGQTQSHIEDTTCDFGQGGTTASPLDVQFLQDLSGSFGDDIANVQLLVPQIVSALRAVQADSRFGASSFIDKPVDPFGDVGEWVYQMELGLTADQDLLSSTYNGLAIRFGNDEPESQIEGLMQLALHSTDVGFRPDSARFVVLFTDAPFHQAGDGVAGGITTPNNGDAIADGGGAGEDYPLIAQVKAALEGANIIPVFAIANGYESNYQSLVGELGRGAVVTLSADSSNVVAAITSGLTAATTTFIEDATGGHGRDTLRGDARDNVLQGNDGDDSLDGGQGRDQLRGDGGNDELTGGAGRDTLTGGAGQDRFSDQVADLLGDTITDLGLDDSLVVTDARFNALRYASDTGRLELDTSGDGSFATWVQLATGLVGEFVAQGSALADPATTTVRLMQDSDGDGVGDFHDNAIHVPNADQRDTDGDGHGNIVDADFDQSGLVDFFDLAQFENRFFTQDPDADLNGDAIVDFFDLAILEGLFYQAPGASYVDAAPAAPMDITPLILLGMAEGAGAGMEGLA